MFLMEESSLLDMYSGAVLFVYLSEETAALMTLLWVLHDILPIPLHCNHILVTFLTH